MFMRLAIRCERATLFQNFCIYRDTAAAAPAMKKYVKRTYKFLYINDSSDFTKECFPTER